MPTKTNRQSLFMAILFTGLLVGLLDGLAAILQYTINGGTKPASVFRYIASAALEKDAFNKEMMTVMGVLFHMLIAMLFTVFFFLVLPKFPWFRKNWLTGGIIYGLFVWVVMSQVVLPLSKLPTMPFRPEKAAVAASILIVCIGIPVSYLANKYYDRQRSVS